jgi:NADH-quinone oxidoreductase subunit C
MLNTIKLSKSLSSDVNIKNFIQEIDDAFGELTITVALENLKKILSTLKDDIKYSFSMLIDICGVDYPSHDKRFEVVYNLLSVTQNFRIRVKVLLNDDEFIPTTKDIFRSAHWYEREIWDMYGIFFLGNDDLRRILTDYGFSGHPMRKDFPLTGHIEVRYDMEKQKVMYEPVKLMQEYRDFDFKSPWEGEQYILPGDEKANK